MALSGCQLCWDNEGDGNEGVQGLKTMDMQSGVNCDPIALH